MTKSKIKSIKKIGKKKTYNLTMKSDQHNYAVYSAGNDDSFVFSANSHSLCYGFSSWISAYLKANYTSEFMVCSLNVANEDKKHDKMIDLERDLKKFGIVLADKDLNHCDVKYKIIKKKDTSGGIDQTIISPSIMVKGIGLPTAQNVADNKPYYSLKDFASKTDFRLVNKDTISSLAEAGFFSNMIKEHYKKTKKRLTKGKIITQFAVIRNDLKKAAKKGVESIDMFD